MQERFEPTSPRPEPGRPLVWTRRRFLGGSVLAGAGVWTAANLVDALAASRARADERPALPRIDTFLDRDQIQELLQIALSRGAEFSEVYGEYTISTEVTIDESKLKTLSYGVLSGVGIRAIQGEVTGYAYADDYDMKACAKPLAPPRTWRPAASRARWRRSAPATLERRSRSSARCR
jgi:hypothetical protein